MGSELEEERKKKKTQQKNPQKNPKNKTAGIVQNKRRSKTGNELPKKVEFPSLELFWARGGTSLLQVVWRNERDPTAVHGNGLNDPGEVPSSQQLHNY